MDDHIPLEVKIAKAKAQDPLLDEQIANAAAINADLGHRLEYYRKIQETQSSKVAHLLGFIEENKDMKRELARIEGRAYHDPDDPDNEYPEPPDDSTEP